MRRENNKEEQLKKSRNLFILGLISMIIGAFLITNADNITTFITNFYNKPHTPHVKEENPKEVVYEGKIIYEEDNVIEESYIVKVDAEAIKREKENIYKRKVVEIKPTPVKEEKEKVIITPKKEEDPKKEVIEDNKVLEGDTTNETPIVSEPTIEEVVNEPIEEPVYTLEPVTPRRTYNYDLDVMQIVTFKAGVSEERKNQFIGLYNKLPYELKSYIMERGVYIVVAPDGSETDGHAGLTDIVCGEYDEDHIGINGSTSKKLQMAVLHEIGHSIDNKIGLEFGCENTTNLPMSSNDPVFQAIYQEEVGKSGFPSYITWASYEYFAESFRYYFEDRSRLNNMPKTKAYIHQYLITYFGLDI